MTDETVKDIITSRGIEGALDRISIRDIKTPELRSLIENIKSAIKDLDRYLKNKFGEEYDWE